MSSVSSENTTNMETIHRFIKEKAPKYTRGIVLDVGGGEGRWKTILEKYSFKYFISDLFSKSADFHDDARKLSNSDSSFDTVVCFEALEHIDDTDAVVSELYRVLKKGGHAIATIPFLFPLHGNPSDYHRLTPAGLEYYFKKAGFEIIESGLVGNLFTFLVLYCRTRLKEYAANKKHLRKWIFIILNQMMIYSWQLFPKDDSHFFTHSFIIAKKN